MSYDELVPQIALLPRQDKLRLLQVIASDLAHEEGLKLVPGETYPVWSPFDAEQASESLLQLLHQDDGDS
jgi:hypothetical protein